MVATPPKAALKADLGKRGITQPRGSQAAQRWALLSQARKITTRKSLRTCGLFSAEGEVKVSLNERGHASVSGVHTCGSKLCPVCSARTSAKQLAALERAADKLLQGESCAVFVTLTLPHRMGDDLGTLIDALQAAWNASMSGRGGKVWREFGKTHYLRALDYTFGNNGHHPHYHAVVFFDRVLTSDDLYWLDMDLRQRWERSIRKTLGRDCVHAAVKLDLVREGAQGGVGAVVRYVGKALTGVLLESLWSQGKAGSVGGRTIWEILRDSETKGWCESLWRDLENGFHKRRWLVCSQGLLALGEDEEEQPDLEEEFETQEEENSVLLSGALWRTINRQGRVSAFLADFENKGLQPDVWKRWRFLCSLSLERKGAPVGFWAQMLSQALSSI